MKLCLNKYTEFIMRIIIIKRIITKNVMAAFVQYFLLR